MIELKQQKYAKIYLDEKFQNMLNEVVQGIESQPADLPISGYLVGKLIGLVFWLGKVERTEV